LKVLSTSDLEFLSLVGVENPDKYGTQRELTRKMVEKMTMKMSQSQTKSKNPE